jgi:hypothetical protein
MCLYYFTLSNLLTILLFRGRVNGIIRLPVHVSSKAIKLHCILATFYLLCLTIILLCLRIILLCLTPNNLLFMRRVNKVIRLSARVSSNVIKMHCFIILLRLTPDYFTLSNLMPDNFTLHKESEQDLIRLICPCLVSH